MDAAAQPALKDALIEIRDINVESHTGSYLHTPNSCLEQHEQNENGM